MKAPAYLWLILIPLLLAACAPRVSKKGPAHPVASAKQAPVEAPAPVVAAPQPAPAPVAPPPAWKPAAAPAPVTLASADTTPEGDDEEEAAAPRAKTYYSYSDDQIRALRKQSPEFRRLDDQLKSCSAKSAQAIERREEIPTEIAKIRMSKGGLNPKKEKQIEKLRAEQDRLKATDHGACDEPEARLTELLKAAYDGASNDEIY